MPNTVKSVITTGTSASLESESTAITSTHILWKSLLIISDSDFAVHQKSWKQTHFLTFNSRISNAGKLSVCCFCSC